MQSQKINKISACIANIAFITQPDNLLIKNIGLFKIVNGPLLFETILLLCFF